MTEPPIRSRPYSTAACCERCVFGRGEHAPFCRYAVVMVPREHGMSNAIADYLDRVFSDASNEFDRLAEARARNLNYINGISIELPPGYRPMTDDEQRANTHNLIP